MKTLLTLSIILSFVGITVFGFLAISHGENMGHSGCIAALAERGICPAERNNPFILAAFHGNFLRSFSLALLSSGAAILMVLGSMFISGWLKISADKDSNLAGVLISFYGNFFRENFNFSKYKTIRWLSFHENSPAVI